MIRSFDDRELAAFWHTRRPPRRWPPIAKQVGRRLALLDAALRPEDLLVPPGNRLEALKGDRAGWYSIRVNDQWRLEFRWDGGPANVRLSKHYER